MKFGGKYFPPYIEAPSDITMLALSFLVWGEIFPPLH